MFKNFYTTQMSGNAKSLQKRFSKIRAGKSKTARLMAMVMTIAILAATLGGAVVMAAIGEDGLEYWDKNEIYLREGFHFNVNVNNRHVPDWTNEIKDEDGNISVMISRVQIRYISGWVEYFYTVKLNDGLKMMCVSSGKHSNTGGVESTGIASIDSYPKTDSFDFWDYNLGYDEKTTKLLGTDFTGKNRAVTIKFGTDDNEYSNPVIGFYNFDKQTQSEGYKFFDLMDAENAAEIGEFINTYKYLNYRHTYRREFFTDYEDPYTNKQSSLFNIKIERADEQGLTLHITSPSDRVKNYCIYGYNGNGIELFRYGSYGESTTASGNDRVVLAPFNANGRKGNMSDYSSEQIVTEKERNGNFSKGSTYRVDVGLINENNNVVYRWQEYITIP